ncbi:MAG: HAD-IIIA family hydrolase [Cyanobacteria bacterium RUI128]|nr:HAD-IIIA family hydrolase [Cyanobacteria bacterium RUI128]
MVSGSIDTVIFDLDGTLLYTLEDLTDSTNYALAKFDFPDRTLDEIRQFVGNGVSLLIERAIPEGKDNPHFTECLELFKEHYSANMFNKTKPYDGVIDMLKRLKDEKYNIAVVSNKFEDAVKGLVDKYFYGLVDVAEGQCDCISKKPAPDAVYDVISKLGVVAENCIMIGDSEVDIETANNAGIPCMSVVWGYKDIDFLYAHGASTLIYTPDDILELI